MDELTYLKVSNAIMLFLLDRASTDDTIRFEEHSEVLQLRFTYGGPEKVVNFLLEPIGTYSPGRPARVKIIEFNQCVQQASPHFVDWKVGVELTVNKLIRRLKELREKDVFV